MASVIWQYGAALVVLAGFVLTVLGGLRVIRDTRGSAIAAGLVLALGLIPVGGLSGACMVLSLSPSLSVAGTALWGMLAYSRLRGTGIMDVPGARALSLMVMALSVAVFASALSPGPFDLYVSGYGFTAWDIVLSLSAIVMFVRGPFVVSCVLLAALLAHASGVMRTANLFDTLVDGPAFIVSSILVARMVFARMGKLPNSRWL